MATKITWRQALAWRLRRQLLDPIGDVPVGDVVRRLCGVQAQVASSADLAVRLRRSPSPAGEVDRALSEGRLIRTWGPRGALHLLEPEEGSSVLSLLAADRLWESWRRYFGMTPGQMDLLRRTIRDALDDRPLTRLELAEAIERRRTIRAAGAGMRSSWGELLKPLAWLGDVCFGPRLGAQVTFIRPEAASRGWRGVPDADDGAPIAIAAYLRAYGPAGLEPLRGWLAGSADKRRLRAWLADLRDRLAEVELDGESAYVLAEDLDELTATGPTTAVRLLPAFDQYVLGPGTADGHVVPTTRRSAVSRPAGRIAPVVVAGGVVSGTWELKGALLTVTWFREAGRAPRAALIAECGRLAGVLNRDLHLSVAVA